MNIFNQYKGLRRENYILFLGRIVTHLGSMIWPVMTLILNQKLGMNATEVAIVTVASGILVLPAGIIGGRIADKFNKKHCIIICDLISIVFYFISAIIPLSYVTIVMIVVAAACQSMEYPIYNALIADITYTKDRDRAYSLSYLGANIGLVASPIIAGVLFEHYLWLSFLISGIAIGISTVLILWKVKNIEPVQEENREYCYQKSKEGESLFHVLWKNKVLLFYIIVMGLYDGAYHQYGYLMPLDLARLHGDKGAVIFGSVSSLNCIVVVIFTPIFTKVFFKIAHTKRNLLGQVMLLIGYVVFLTMLGKIPAYYVSITLFTFGEILTTTANGPYLSARIPESHRGRINGFKEVIKGVLTGLSLFVVGKLYDNCGSQAAWIFIFSILGVAIVGGLILVFWDKRFYREIERKEEW